MQHYYASCYATLLAKKMVQVSLVLERQNHRRKRKNNDSENDELNKYVSRPKFIIYHVTNAHTYNSETIIKRLNIKNAVKGIKTLYNRQISQHIVYR